jgi:transcriptional regulator with XRE-family HTH domain
MRDVRLSQAELAKLAGVSQATVSRALRETNQKHSDARKKLFIYAGLEDMSDPSSTARGINLVSAAFSKIWDGSDAHALAVARIIESLDGLRPDKE